MSDTDARLWHPWLRINRVLRVMLHTRWSAAAWSLHDGRWEGRARPGKPGGTEIRVWRAHERVRVKRG